MIDCDLPVLFTEPTMPDDPEPGQRRLDAPPA